MKFLPPKPYVDKVCAECFGDTSKWIDVVHLECFNQWYDREIAPLFENGITVWNHGEKPIFIAHEIIPHPRGLSAMMGDSKTIIEPGCGINLSMLNLHPIRPIEKEPSAEELLKEIINNYEDGNNNAFVLARRKAKAWLKSREGK